MKSRINQTQTRWIAKMSTATATRIFTLLLVGFTTSSAFGSDEALTETARQIGITTTDLRQRLLDCDRNQSTMNICAQYHWVEQDIELKESYYQAVTRLGESPAKAKLITAQRAWLTFRDRDCTYEASGVEGGTMHATLELNCRRERTKERIAHLKEFLACVSPGCPGEW